MVTSEGTEKVDCCGAVCAWSATGLKANRWPPPRDRYSERGFLFIYLPWNKSPSAPSRGQRAAKDGFRAGQQRLRGRVA